MSAPLAKAADLPLASVPVAASLTRQPYADDLLRRVGLALELAWQALEDIATSGPDSLLGLAAVGDKVVAETALLLCATSHLRAKHRAIETAALRLTERLIPLARSAQVRAAVCMDPVRAIDHAMPHIVLGQLGHPDPLFDALLQASLHTGRHMGAADLPHRQLEHAWLEQIWPLGAPSVRRRAQALAASALSRPLDALRIGRDDVYAFTHAVLFASDLGRRPRAVTRRRKAIEADALVALAFALDTQDHDLTAEVLWTWPMLGMRWHQGALFALEWLREAQDALGCLPGKSYDARQCNEMPPSHRPRYLRATCYHATYVMGFLCAAALRPGCTPLAATPGRQPGHAKGAGAVMLKLLGQPGEPWGANGVTRRPAEQDALSGMLLSVVLRQAAQRGDLASIHTALCAAQPLGLHADPAPVQAAALLTRGQCLMRLGG
jgi:hypothetical protein